jgi:hypothetical protein
MTMQFRLVQVCHLHHDLLFVPCKASSHDTEPMTVLHALCFLGRYLTTFLQPMST